MGEDRILIEWRDESGRCSQIVKRANGSVQTIVENGLILPTGLAPYVEDVSEVSPALAKLCELVAELMQK